MKEEKIFKTFRTIVIKADDKEEGVIDMLIPMSTAKTDRHGESIDPKGWKKHLKAFKKRAILLSSHNYGSLQNQIGELLDIQVVEEGLLARPKYYINQGNPEADWGYFLATRGKAAYSVGFIPLKWKDAKEEPTRTFTEQELVEISQVTVPSNTDAAQGLMAQKEYKEYDPIVKEIIDEVLKDPEMVDYYDSRLIIPYKKDREELFKLADPEGTNFVAVDVRDKIMAIRAKYNCSCIKCGHKMTSDKHCKEIKCPKCGGTMRRVERPGPGEEGIKDTVKDKIKDLKADPIDPEKVKASIEREEKLEKMVEELKTFPEIKYFVTDDDGVLTEDKEDWENWKEMAMEFAEKYIIFNRENKELKRKLKDLELEAGAVLNAKNKSNLKNAQALIQVVLDSAGAEESLDNKEGEEKDTKTEDPADTKTDDKKEDPGKNGETEEEKAKAIEEVITKTIAKKMNYLVGKIEQ